MFATLIAEFKNKSDINNFISDFLKDSNFDFSGKVFFPANYGINDVKFSDFDSENFENNYEKIHNNKFNGYTIGLLFNINDSIIESQDIDLIDIIVKYKNLMEYTFNGISLKLNTGISSSNKGNGYQMDYPFDLDDKDDLSDLKELEPYLHHFIVNNGIKL